MAVTPTPANGCLGSTTTGAVDRRLKCLKSVDDDGNPVFTCSQWRLFYVNCPKINVQCNPYSSAYVAARVVCSQRLF